MNAFEGGREWLGTGWSFPPEFSRRSRTVAMVSDEEDIRQSLWILLSTSPGERIMNPAYGCGLKSLIFESINESTVNEIRDLVDRAVLFFEPRVRVDRIQVDLEEVYGGLINVNLDYTIRITNSRSNLVYPFYFQEGNGPAS